MRIVVTHKLDFDSKFVSPKSRRSKLGEAAEAKIAIVDCGIWRPNGGRSRSCVVPAVHPRRISSTPEGVQIGRPINCTLCRIQQLCTAKSQHCSLSVSRRQHAGYLNFN